MFTQRPPDGAPLLTEPTEVLGLSSHVSAATDRPFVEVCDVYTAQLVIPIRLDEGRLWEELVKFCADGKFKGFCKNI